MSTRKASNVVAMPDAATKSGESKYTYNFRTADESITIRTDDKDELLSLREELRNALLGPSKATLDNGDDCPSACGGTLRLRNGAKGNFLGCSNYPRCHFTSRA
jgi:hypothetical protein